MKSRLLGIMFFSAFSISITGFADDIIAPAGLTSAKTLINKCAKAYANNRNKIFKKCYIKGMPYEDPSTNGAVFGLMGIDAIGNTCYFTYQCTNSSTVRIKSGTPDKVEGWRTDGTSLIG